MKAGDQYYEMFLKFFDTYAPAGFKEIDTQDPLILKLEEMMEANDQFFYIGDMLRYEIFFVSKRTVQMLGVEPKDFTPYSLIKNIHQDDFDRQNMGRAKMFKMTHDVYKAGKGYSFFSTNFKTENATGQYINLLNQVLIFFSTIPYKSVFLIKVHTNVDWCKKLMNKYHYYTGIDLSFFRTPDEKLLMTTVPYTKREFEILKLAATGMHSEEIAKKLFISTETVYTHRRNIIEKSTKSSLSDVIIDLIEKGVL